MQLFVSDKDFVKVYGMTSPKEFSDALKLFCKEVEVPRAFIVDPPQVTEIESSKTVHTLRGLYSASS